MKKILFVVGQLDIGGIECWLRDLTDLLSEKKSNLDIYILVDKPHKGSLEEDFVEKNIKILRVHSSKKSKLLYTKDLFILIKKYKFDIIHSNVSFTNGIILLLGFLRGVPIRISHIHSNRDKKNFSFTKKIVLIILKTCIECFSTKKIAVSDQSKKNYLIQKNVLVMPCGINLNIEKINDINVKEKFNFNDNDNDNIIILCSIGRLEKVKNHQFIIDLIPKLPYRYKYLIAGDGSLRHDLETLVNNLKLQDRVIFLGNINNVISFLKNNIDILLFPSLHEGFGLVAIESQIAGIPVIASTEVPLSTKISDNIRYLELNDNIWINNIINTDKKSDLIINSDDFNINHNYNKLMGIYFKK